MFAVFKQIVKKFNAIADKKIFSFTQLQAPHLLMHIDDIGDRRPEKIYWYSMPKYMYNLIEI